MADDTIPFEMIKVSMSQTKDGWKIVLAIHPHDRVEDIAELAGHPVGTRYMAALVKLEDNDTPSPRLGPRLHDHYISDAGMLCRNPLFQRYLVESFIALTPTENDAVDAIHRHCGIGSRNELGHNKGARRLFDELRMAFARSTHGQT